MEDTIPPVRTRRKQARPGELLAAALDCFAEKGFAATRMEEIARRAGVAKGTFYLYFPSKEAVFEALVRENILPRLEAMEAGARMPGAGAADRLRAILAGVSLVVGNPCLVAIPKLVMAEAGNFPDMARFYRKEVVERGLRLLGGILRDGIAAGEFRPMADPEITARLFMAPVLLAAIWRTSFAAVEEQPLSVDTLLSTHAELFLRSIQAEPGMGGAA
ncbi:TetR/AcrR family transcriptional regulator [Niveispirillum sp.]|uniref:TetR/AcrR family transcriptional regulator n=1 Tax=Niveispirillum sp. TaxID=1917217 RepID=UPI001B6B0830|nr:TetR/AcrR family transcriptional regulator [Niveispirillum sp.]MBP7338287.1 TetR/AcrR family transcriptional regulator [Niveispirillum sp.]